jgi:hypothetical protein
MASWGSATRKRTEGDHYPAGASVQIAAHGEPAPRLPTQDGRDHLFVGGHCHAPAWASHQRQQHAPNATAATTARASHSRGLLRIQLHLSARLDEINMTDRRQPGYRAPTGSSSWGSPKSARPPRATIRGLSREPLLPYVRIHQRRSSSLALITAGGPSVQTRVEGLICSRGPLCSRGTRTGAWCSQHGLWRSHTPPDCRIADAFIDIGEMGKNVGSSIHQGSIVYTCFRD